MNLGGRRIYPGISLEIEFFQDDRPHNNRTMLNAVLVFLLTTAVAAAALFPTSTKQHTIASPCGPVALKLATEGDIHGALLAAEAAADVLPEGDERVRSGRQCAGLWKEALGDALLSSPVFLNRVRRRSHDERERGRGVERGMKRLTRITQCWKRASSINPWSLDGHEPSWPKCCTRAGRSILAKRSTVHLRRCFAASTGGTATSISATTMLTGTEGTGTGNSFGTGAGSSVERSSTDSPTDFPTDSATDSPTDPAFDAFGASVAAHLRCCSFGVGSDSYRMIPAVRETHITVRLPSARLLRIDQEGWLRLFDPSTILWPAGYLLAQFLGRGGWEGGRENVRQGGGERRNDDASHHSSSPSSSVPASPPWCDGGRVLELGSGVGAAAMAAASCGGDVIATDKAGRSLALIVSNAALNGIHVTVGLGEESEGGEDGRGGGGIGSGGGGGGGGGGGSADGDGGVPVPAAATTSTVAAATAAATATAVGRVRVEPFDYLNDGDVDRLVAAGPYDAIVGAALQFEQWPQGRMWHVLRRLTSPPRTAVEAVGTTADTTEYTHARRTVVIMSHMVSSDALRPPPGSGFEISSQVRAYTRGDSARCVLYRNPSEREEWFCCIGSVQNRSRRHCVCVRA